jgi:hypothetical protein
MEGSRILSAMVVSSSKGNVKEGKVEECIAHILLKVGDKEDKEEEILNCASHVLDFTAPQFWSIVSTIIHN